MSVSTNTLVTNVGASSVGGLSNVGFRSSTLLAVVTANTAFTLPANAFLQMIKIKNNTANAVTGGLMFGTTAGGTDIVVAKAVGANALTHVTDATLLLRMFAAAQIIYFDAVSSWNSASLDVTFVYGQL